MTPNYPKMVADTLSELPVKRQEEIYNYTQFVKRTTKIKVFKRTSKNGSVFDMFGTAKSKVTDGSVNHDKYLYE